MNCGRVCRRCASSIKRTTREPHALDISFKVARGFSMDTPTIERERVAAAETRTETEEHGTISMRLTSIRYPAADINLYEMRRPDNAPLPSVAPGAHIDVHLPNGLMRQYSLVTADGDPRAYVVGIKRD